MVYELAPLILPLKTRTDTPTLLQRRRGSRKSKIFLGITSYSFLTVYLFWQPFRLIDFFCLLSLFLLIDTAFSCIISKEARSACKENAPAAKTLFFEA